MTRRLLVLPMAFIVTVSLFWFMAWMVSYGNVQTPKATSGLRFDMVMMEHEDDVQRRHRQLPKPPKPPVSPTASSPMHAQPVATPQPQFTSPVSIPAVNVNTSLKGVNVEVPSIGKLQQTQQSMPVTRVEPSYPMRALKRNIEGFVIVRFDIDTDGSPTNIRVIEAKPGHIFNRAALRAVRRWKYQPYRVDGVATIVKNQQTKLEFRIAK